MTHPTQTQTIDQLFLELSQFTQATTAKELALMARVAQLEAGRQWRTIESAPKDGRKVVLFYTNRSTRPRTVMAKWLTQEQVDEMDDDGFGLDCGWYECIDNWAEYTNVAIHEGEPTHWMPLPPQPTQAGEVK